VLNLVPVLDTLVSLIAFMLFTMSFIILVSVESPFPEASPNSVQEAIKQKPLQLTLTVRDGEVEVWSPFSLVAPKKIPNEVPAQPNLRAIHEYLVTVKQKFPTENKIVLVPENGTSYDVLIAIMDTVRMLEPSDPAIFAANTSGTTQALKGLFPDVIFGNLLGDK
jgi:biopolymer transport protein ExbD